MKRIARFFGNWMNTLQTFPVAHMLLLFLTGVTIFAIYDNYGNEEILIKLMLAGGVAFLISILGSLWQLHTSQATKKKNMINGGIQLLALVVGVGYYFLLHYLGEINHYAMGLVIFGIFPLLVLAIPTLYVQLFHKQETKTWISRRNVLQSLVFGIHAGLIVRGGLSGALGSIGALFDIDINRRWYQYFGAISMIFLAGSFIFNHYLFVSAGISSHPTQDIEIFPSRTRKVFGSYIFLPLALIYLAIFFAYGVKIFITGVWPKGIIVRLGVGYFALGMITFLFTYPEKAKFFEYIRKVIFSSFLFVAIMMMSAIGQRIAQYGITINRYLICALVVAILLFSLLLLWFPRKRLSVFVWTFFGVMLFAFYSPWNAPNTALYAQKTRMESLLIKENIYFPLGKGALKNLTGDAYQIIAYPKKYGDGLLESLVTNYPFEKRSKGLIASDFSFSSPDLKPWKMREELYEYLGLSRERNYNDNADTQYFDYHTPFRQGIDVEGYAKMYYFDSPGALEKNTFSYTLQDKNNQDSLQMLDLNPYLADLEKFALENKNTPSEERSPYIIDVENKRFVITTFDIIKGKNTSEIQYLDGYILVK